MASSPTWTRDLDLRQLEVLVHIVELGSFTKASRAVHLSQATVSERIATLEATTGYRLLDRAGRSVTPTAAGELLYRRAKELLRLREQTCLELEELRGLERGELRLGGSTVPGEHILPAVIARFREEHPGVSVRLAIAGSSEIARKVLDGDLELGVVGTARGPKGLRFQPLWSDELVLLVPVSHRWARAPSISLAELQQEPFVAREAGSGTRQVLESHLSMSLEELDLVAELGSSTAVEAAVLHGLGVGVLSRRAVAAEVDARRLAVVPLEQGPITRDFHLITSTRRSPSPPCVAFSELLLAHEG